MSNSKKDFNIVSQLFVDFINNLTDVQFNNLIDGTADIKYAEKALDASLKDKYEAILYKIVSINDRQEKVSFIRDNEQLENKAKLLGFCKYFKVDAKNKDTVETIINNIIEFSEKNSENVVYRFNKKENIEDSIDKIAQDLETFMDVEEAKKYIKSCNSVDSKVNLLKLAKKLNVFISDRESSYDIILDSIIKSVVEAKIRSYTIRKKFIEE